MQSVIRQSVKKPHGRNRGCRIGKQSIWGGNKFDGIDERKRILLGFELKRESIGGYVDQILLEGDFGIAIDREIVKEDETVRRDSENGIGEIVIRVRKRVKVEANPMAAGLRNEESVSGIAEENPGGAEERQCPRGKRRDGGVFGDGIDRDLNIFFGGKERGRFAIGFENPAVVETGLVRGAAVDQVMFARGKGKEGGVFSRGKRDGEEEGEEEEKGGEGDSRDWSPRKFSPHGHRKWRVESFCTVRVGGGVAAAEEEGTWRGNGGDGNWRNGG